MIEILRTLPDMIEAVAIANSAENEADRVTALCGLALDLGHSAFETLDPFSPQYKQAVLDLHARVSGRAVYNPENDELAPYLVDTGDAKAGHYGPGRTAYAGEILASMGSILQTLDLRAGQKMLEYGVGEGGIALEAAKCGVDVTVVDIEQRYLSIINARARAIDVNVNTVLGEFGCDTGALYDVVLFYEAFHHAINHLEVARAIRGMLVPGGRLILAGEPIIGPHNEIWRSSVPYPWGLRMDGLSFRVIQTYGWMELGFDHDYFLEMLHRAGYRVEFKRSTATDRANCYVAAVA